MTDIETRIITMLKEGQPYGIIQEELGVSSKTIARIKKEFLAQDSDTQPLNSSDGHDQDENTKAAPIVNTRNAINILQPDADGSFTQNGILPPRTTYGRSEEEIALDEYRAKLHFDLEMAKLQNEFRKAERADEIREEELRNSNLQLEMEREVKAAALRRDELNAENLRFKLEQESIERIRKEELKADQERMVAERARLEQARIVLTKKFKSVISDCQEGEWTYEEMTDYVKRVKKLRAEMNHGYVTQEEGLIFFEQMEMLDNIVQEFSELLEDWDEDSYEIEFDEEFIDHLDFWTEDET